MRSARPPAGGGVFSCEPPPSMAVENPCLCCLCSNAERPAVVGDGVSGRERAAVEPDVKRRSRDGRMRRRPGGEPQIVRALRRSRRVRRVLLISRESELTCPGRPGEQDRQARCAAAEGATSAVSCGANCIHETPHPSLSCYSLRLKEM